LKTLILDNYDSFTFNLFQLIAELHGNPVVFKNNELDLAAIKSLHPSHIVISPGPGTVENPQDFGICHEVILKLGGKIPLLGVCLGHQGIWKAFGGTIETAPTIMHGKQSLIEHAVSKLFQKIPNPFTAMRYHSLMASPKNPPPELKITAWSKDENVIMAIEHSKDPIFGIQFHPESFATLYGQQILQNFLA